LNRCQLVPLIEYSLIIDKRNNERNGHVLSAKISGSRSSQAASEVVAMSAWPPRREIAKGAGVAEGTLLLLPPQGQLLNDYT